MGAPVPPTTRTSSSILMPNGSTRSCTRSTPPFYVDATGARRHRVDLSFAAGVAVVSPEDAILSKLEWARTSDSERQIRDAANVVEMNPGLDREYIERWAAPLGVTELWRRVAPDT